ncbi:NAD(P)-dependent oxidoreductase [Gymnodinialimonas ceratoperidinii]|uniref:NAD(P)-dependent oxidoreductase n=1 Tax=Gymnodinialimonas ceratoperidinii TaxID=2856823 RepID=A0A8F6TT09_9RHOB|nr:NAD(P)-dependent oxidoreductase [Gymnodinialimonas ceratoperidinii]QXT38195.1 NAD(P)-dependent oxidoreductase [Gymnodinialimonas ceratoperidinii]
MNDKALKVGVFGLGLIGTALAGRLLAAGYAVAGTDPSAERCKAFKALGGTLADSADIWSSDVVFSCVFDTAQLADLIAQAPGTEAVLVSMSTCDPDQMAPLATKAQARGITLIEAPISGTSKALAAGDVLLLVAGAEAAVARAAPLLDALARQFLHVGEIGNGNRAKLAINLVLGLHRAALAEGMVFAEAIGLDAADFLEMAKASAAYSAVMDAKGDALVHRDFTPLGRIAQSAKDFELIRDQAKAAGQGLPFTGTYLDMMRDALAAGEGDLDNAAVLLPISRAVPEG